MVYASDFYTTRRPYSTPTVTSYSVTVSFCFLIGLQFLYIVDDPKMQSHAICVEVWTRENNVEVLVC